MTLEELAPIAEGKVACRTRPLIILDMLCSLEEGNTCSRNLNRSLSGTGYGNDAEGRAVSRHRLISGNDHIGLSGHDFACQVEGVFSRGGYLGFGCRGVEVEVDVLEGFCREGDLLASVDGLGVTVLVGDNLYAGD